ncbi:MAG: ECF transporter S component [Firmicutes bacterium]|nr:ECF transporter S component [Bacillota bacterium]
MKFAEALKSNGSFVLVCLVIIAVMVFVAFLFEKANKKRNNDTTRILTTHKIVMIGMLSAIAGILHCFDFAIPIAPAFYKLDFSELAALIGGFAFGPVAGVLIEFIKILVKLVIKSTSTAFVGDLANFLVGCMLVLPASVIYQYKKSKKTALIGCITGTLIMTVFGTIFNALYLIPAFAKLYGMPIDVILKMGAAIHPSIDNIWNFVLLCVAPLNLIKGGMISVITMLVYKRISPILKRGKM